MEQLAILERELQLLDAQQLRSPPPRRPYILRPHVTVDGRRMLAFCSNDYLGLASDPHLVEALCDGASRYSVGSGGSHLISGHSYAHALLEERFAEMLAPFWKCRALCISARDTWPTWLC
jgi:8-amino-7-oxononanoate synthase